jgi:2-methylcitrate dehydratase MmgE/PrpD-like protein
MFNATSSPGSTEKLAQFVAGPHAGAAFDDALRAARTYLLDARRALQTPSATSELASRALASYGAPLRRTFTAAVVLSGAAGDRTDAAIVAAAVSSSELVGRSETDVVEAIAIGREVATRLDRALTFDAPWDAAGVIAGIGAAAAAARAAGLDAGSARNAIGLAATQATGLGVAEGTPAAALAIGKAAADAVEAALLARNGFTAASAALEGRRGLAALMASRFDATLLCDALGSRWYSVSHDTS